MLYVLSIPWYRTGGDDTGELLGLPSWVAVALVCYAVAAFANAAAWLLTDVEDAPDPSDALDAQDAPEGSDAREASR